MMSDHRHSAMVGAADSPWPVRRGLLLILIWVVAAGVGCASAGDHHHSHSCPGDGDDVEEPWGVWDHDDGETPSLLEAPRDGEIRSGPDALIALYQNHLRGPTTDEGGCPFHPSCSQYARQSFSRYGAVGGLVLTMDRLFVREHVFLEGNYEVVCPHGDERYYDPAP